jgi:competence protein ComEC
MQSRIFSKPVVLAMSSVLVATGVGGYVWRQEHRPPFLEVYVFSIKQGNAVLVRTPDDRRIVINGGGNSEVIRHVSRVLPFYSRRIDTIIATDTQKKHVGGLVELVGRYDIGQMIVSGVTLETLGISTSTDVAYIELLQTLRRGHVSIRDVLAGESLVWGQDATGRSVCVNIVFPVLQQEFAYSKASPPALVLDITYGSTHIFVAGDSTPKIQKYIIEQRNLDSADVLVVSHSASANHFNKTFLHTLDPEYLVYTQSTSRSSSNVVVPYERRFNTKEKTVRIVSDGSSVRIERMD